MQFGARYGYPSEREYVEMFGKLEEKALQEIDAFKSEVLRECGEVETRIAEVIASARST